MLVVYCVFEIEGWPAEGRKAVAEAVGKGVRPIYFSFGLIIPYINFKSIKKGKSKDTRTNKLDAAQKVM